MKNVIIVVFSIILFSSCGTKKIESTNHSVSENAVSKKGDINNAVNGKYTIFEVDGENLKDHNFDGKMPIMIFNNKNMSYSTSIGCNQISGKYEIDDTTIKFLPGMSTMMMCPGNLEGKYTKALSEVDNYKLEAFKLKMFKGDVLKIIYISIKR